MASKKSSLLIPVLFLSIKSVNKWNACLISESNAAGKVIAGHMSSTATAQTITSTEVSRAPDSFGDIVRGVHVYGAKVLRGEALVSAFYGID